MTEEIEIFNRKDVLANPANDALLAAIEKAAPLALKAVAGNNDDTIRVKGMYAELKKVAKTEGRVGALQYMAQAAVV